MSKTLTCLVSTIAAFALCGSIALGQENQFYNSEFDDGLNGWGSYGSAGFTREVVQSGALSGTNSVLLDITNASAATSIGIYQVVPDLVQGQTYPFGFTAKADQEREMVVLIQLHKPEGPQWIDIFLTRVQLTTEPQKYALEYTHEDEGTADHPGWTATMYLMLKGAWWSMVGDNLNSKIWIDWVYFGAEPEFQDRTRAVDPTPADGSIYEDTWVNLNWLPGDFAVSHDLYLGENFDDVNDGLGDTFRGNKPSGNVVVGFPGFPYPDGLVPGTTYYWRVDEVNDADPNSPWKGDVWSFTVPSRTAYAPSPPDGERFVLTDAVLDWMGGLNSKLHTEHFGDNFDDISSSTAGVPQAVLTYTPGTLERNKTYYWRIDEFDGANTYTGDIWSFTTVPDVAITDADLVGWWTLDEGEGSTAVDWSGHDGHGTLIGGPQWVDGFQGTALEFSGSEQYVDCGDEAGAGVTADFTLAAWAQMTPGNAGQYMGIAGKLRNVGGYNGFGLVRHSSNVFRLWVSDGDTGGINGVASSDVTYTDADWHHITGVREGRSNILYVDGVRQTASNETDFVPSPDFFHIGRQYSHMDDRYFEGKIDDVRVYDKALTDAQIAELMRGDTKQAGSPVPDRDALVQIPDISSLSWSAGSTAASHDVYLGTGRDAVANADRNAPEFQGNQAGTSLSLAGLVEFGGGDYYWRIDEVEAGGAVNAGTIWKFTVPDYLIVDNFEDYDDIDPAPGELGANRIFDKWIDGFGTATNGAIVGHDLPPYAEQTIVHSGAQSMIYRYDNNLKTSEAILTLVSPRDWTEEGVAELSLWFQGDSANAVERLYVAVANATGPYAVMYHEDPDAVLADSWTQWVIP
ncbi:MAG: carbohydrate binding domain-containing protein, partial [Phycisphaerales bacterium]